MPTEILSPGTARRTALAAQGFDRPRQSTARLFGFDYRIEIYTPAGATTSCRSCWAIAWCVDLKADRAASCLRVQAAHLEPRMEASRVVAAFDDVFPVAGPGRVPVTCRP